MEFRSFSILLLHVVFYGKFTQSVNIECNVREMTAGYVCVCNATYCDTVEAPTALPRGSYYHYSTSADSPGFSVSVQQFLNTTDGLLGTSNDVYITVDSSLQYQTFEGVGASVTVGSGIMIKSLPSETKQKFIESYFGESGLGYSFVRVPIAASDFAPYYYTYDDVPGDVELKYFNLTDEDFQIKIPLLQMVKNVSKRGVKLIGSTWSAPDWMKTNNNYKFGYIRKKYLGVWANYYLKFLQAYKENGLEFWGLTQGNEVNIALYFGPWFPIPNTLFPPLVARYWTKKYLGPLIESSGFENVKLLAMDDERPFMQWYMDRMLADKESAQYIDGAALHFYLDSSSNIHNLQDFHIKHPDKFILYTEASINFFSSPGGKSVELGDWNRAEVYILSILTNLNNWVVGYIDWNIALNDQGGPTGPANLTLDAAVIINKTNGEFYKQPLFYALGHFSKFIPPGSKKINITIDQPFTEENFFKFEAEIRKYFEPLPTGGPTPTGGLPPTGGPPPTTGPTPTGGPPPTGGPYTAGPTPAPFPTRPPTPPATTISALASANPDGSYTVIAYNPRTEPVNIIIMDPKVGVLNRTVEARSLNTFIYWSDLKEEQV